MRLLQRLRFNNNWENEFINSYNTKSIVHQRMMSYMGFTIAASFTLLDQFQKFFTQRAAYQIALGSLCLGLLLIALCTYISKFVKYNQLILPVLCVLVISFSDYLFAAAIPENVKYLRAAQILVTLCFYTTLRLRFGYAALAGWVYTSTTILGGIATGTWTTIEWNLFGGLLVSANLVGMLTAFQLEKGVRNEFLQHKLIAAEREKGEQLLLNILPQPIALKLKDGNNTIADQFDQVTVLFADLVGFSAYASQTSASDVVWLLNEVFSRFDNLAELHRIEKIKTIGDAYMGVAGLPSPNPEHAYSVANMALDMLETVKRINTELGVSLNVRIGINTGSVVAGVIGKKKFIYDLWGDTVNISSRMESQGEAGLIQVTQQTHSLLDGQFQFESRGTIKVKGIGDLQTYWLKERIKNQSRIAS